MLVETATRAIKWPNEVRTACSLENMLARPRWYVEAITGALVFLERAPVTGAIATSLFLSIHLITVPYISSSVTLPACPTMSSVRVPQRA